MNLLPIYRQARAHRMRAGMVLFEVIIALSIFAMVAFALVIALHSGFDAAMDRNAVDAATRGLGNQMTLLHAARVQPGERDLPDDGSGFLYHVSIVQEQLQDQKKQPVQNTYRATITASWKSGGEAQQRDVSQLVYQP